MSDHDLPEDLSQWPTDPFALLGVNQETDRKSLRRAYARLIRVYKPEHHPEHFRRLRDAYELLDQRLSWMEANRATSDDGTVPSIDFADGLTLAAEDRADPQLQNQPARPMLAELDGPWRAALAGDLASAYAAYRQLVHQGQADELVYARLHWLLRIDGQLDPKLDRRDWLMAGMTRCGLTGRLTELYRCELAEDPAEALHERWARALHSSGQPGLLAHLVAARWGAAAKLAKWEIITSDLGELRGRLHEETPIWGHLLLLAIDHLAWAKQPACDAAMAECRKEIEQLAEHWPPIAGELNQRDALGELVDACDRLANVATLPKEWRKALRALLLRCWNVPLENFRGELIDVLFGLVQNPIIGMRWLDQVEAHCRPALQYFANLCFMFANDCGVGRQAPMAEELLDRLTAFVAAAAQRMAYPARWKKWLSTAQFEVGFGRKDLLFFCLQESITVRQLIDCVAASSRQELFPFLQQANNGPLHIVCLAYLAFWT
jgi:hypothetical protein